ncbi:class E sortase [Leifsonia poae]|uniref:class E sortase n=1 Tax=Leifsonia poae TaxID=110933 RepID=UPI001CBF1A73|nr:class E sortase [Leifsonia poae]
MTESNEFGLPAAVEVELRRPRTGKRGGKKKRPPRRPTFFGVLGELLITAGVLVLLFLGWQVWWNSLVLAGQQTSAASTQSQKWIEQAKKNPPPANVDPVKPPVMTEPADYQSFAVVYIPRLGQDWKRTIRETVDTEKVLNSYDAGVGHYKGTQMPGAVGNFAVAGHDSGWGNTFIDLSKLHIGDHIYVQTADGWYTYTFRNFEFVQPTAVTVINPVPGQPDATATDRLMTITTCNPPFHAGERLIAYNVFTNWQAPADVPSEIAAQVNANGG